MHIHYDNRRRKNSLNWNKNFERPRKGAAIWFIGKQIFVFVCMWKQTSSFFVSMWKQIKCGFLCQCGSKLCFFWCQCGSKLCFCVHAKENCFWIHVETNFFSNFSVGMWSTHRLLQANVTFLGKSNKSFFCGKSSAPPPATQKSNGHSQKKESLYHWIKCSSYWSTWCCIFLLYQVVHHDEGVWPLWPFVSGCNTRSLLRTTLIQW